MLARKWRKRIFVCCLWECRLVQALWKTVWKFLKILKIELPYSKVSACNAGDPGSIPGSRRSPGEGNGNPLQYFFLGSPMDRGAWRATVRGVTKSWTQLSNWVCRFKFLLQFLPRRAWGAALLAGLEEAVHSPGPVFVTLFPEAHTLLWLFFFSWDIFSQCLFR